MRGIIPPYKRRQIHQGIVSQWLLLMITTCSLHVQKQYMTGARYKHWVNIVLMGFQVRQTGSKPNELTLSFIQQGNSFFKKTEQLIDHVTQSSHTCCGGECLWTYETAFYLDKPLFYLAQYCLLWLAVTVQAEKGHSLPTFTPLHSFNWKYQGWNCDIMYTKQLFF